VERQPVGSLHEIAARIRPLPGEIMPSPRLRQRVWAELALHREGSSSVLLGLRGSPQGAGDAPAGGCLSCSQAGGVQGEQPDTGLLGSGGRRARATDLTGERRCGW
jgi:hypothetical protein